MAMLEKTGKKQTAAHCRQNDYQDRGVRATAAFRSGQWVFLDLLPVAVTAADWRMTSSYLKLLMGYLGSYWILSSTTATVTIDEEEKPTTISSDWA